MTADVIGDLAAGHGLRLHELAAVTPPATDVMAEDT